MAKRRLTSDEQIIDLLQHLLVIELWRGGLSQNEIRTRLGISINAVNQMLKGIARGNGTQSK
jgi:Trp operon repressor